MRRGSPRTCARPSRAATASPANCAPWDSPRFPSVANFLLVPTPKAFALARALRAGGIAIRPFRDLPGIGDAFRITAAPWPVMERALAAAASCQKPDAHHALRLRRGQPALAREGAVGRRPRGAVRDEPGCRGGYRRARASRRRRIRARRARARTRPRRPCVARSPRGFHASASASACSCMFDGERRRRRRRARHVFRAA